MLRGWSTCPERGGWGSGAGSARERGDLREDPAPACQYACEGHQEEPRDSLVVHGRTRRGHKLKEKMFQPCTRRCTFAHAGKGCSLPMEVVHSPFLEDLKTQLDRVLSNPSLNSELTMHGAPFQLQLHYDSLLFHLAFGRQRRGLLLVEITCSITLSLATQQHGKTHHLPVQKF